MNETQQTKTVTDYRKIDLEKVDNDYLFRERAKYTPCSLEYQELNKMIDIKNQKLISSVIKKFFNSYLNGKDDMFEELTQQGNIGILKGLQTYDPARAKFSTYIYPFILHEMKDYIDKQHNGVTSHYASNQKKIRDAIAEFEAVGKTYRIMDISIKTGLKTESIRKAMQIEQAANLLFFDNDSYIDTMFSEHFDSPEKQYIEKEKTCAIEQALHHLTPEQETIIRMKLGFDGERMSFREISSILGKNSEDLKKIYNEGIRQLRTNAGLIKMFPDYLRRSKRYLNRNAIPVIPKSYAETELEMYAKMSIKRNK